MDENIKEKIRILSSVLDVDDDSKKNKISSSLRLKDPDWFEGNHNDILYIFFYINT